MHHCYPKTLTKNRQHNNLIGTVRTDLKVNGICRRCVYDDLKCRFSS